MADMDSIDDRSLAKKLGYPATAGGYKAARQFVERRGLKRLDDRRPATYRRSEVEAALAAFPKAPGNFTTGPARREQTIKAICTKARRANRAKQDEAS